LMEVHIYSGNPLETLGQGGYVDTGGQTTRRAIKLPRAA
jgi:hypothetical protein